jgi:uncharacterized membrane protein YdjX (TVP38/TMEM64 family)
MSESSAPAPSRRLWRPLILVAVVVGLLILAKVLGLGERLAELRDWIGGLGALGPFVYVGLYVIAVVLAIPGSAITVVAGVLFGSVIGILVVSVASVTGATCAFLISRYFARAAIADWLSRNEKFARLDRMVERHGAIVVAITRLVPIFPFNLLNYGFGLTRVPVWTYVFWSWLCMLPGTVLFVAGGDTLTRVLAEGRVPWGLTAFVAAVLILTLLLAHLTRRYLRKKEADGTRTGQSPG